FEASNFNIVRSTDQIRAGGTQDWTAVDYTFNSEGSTQLWIYAGVYGGNSGALWLDDIQINETDLVYVTRGRAGTPLKVYDRNNPNKVYKEGTDYNYMSDPAMTSIPVLFNDVYHPPPTVALPSTTRLKAGQIVAIDSYDITPVP